MTNEKFTPRDSGTRWEQIQDILDEIQRRAGEKNCEWFKGEDRDWFEFYKEHITPQDLEDHLVIVDDLMRDLIFVMKRGDFNLARDIVQTYPAVWTERLSGTPLEYAFILEHDEKKLLPIVDFLLKFNPNLLRVSDGDTCLSRCAASGFIEVAQKLIQQGAPVDSKWYKENKCCYPLTRAIFNRKFEFAKFWIEAEKDLSGLSDVYAPRCRIGSLSGLAEFEDLSFIQFLFDKGLPKECFYARSLLSDACERGRLEDVKYLVSQVGVDSPCFSKTPLMASAVGGNAEVSIFLIENGANQDLRSNDGHLYMDFACRPGFVHDRYRRDMAEYLKQRNIDKDPQKICSSLGILPGSNTKSLEGREE